jgi:hypothetical protein
LDEEHSGERPFLPTFFGCRKKVWSFGKDANRKTAWMQVSAENYKDTHRNKPENYFLGATRYQGCLVNSFTELFLTVTRHEYKQ